MQIVKDCVVTSNFQLFDGKGELIDSSDSDGPLVYLHGADELLPGLEVALSGREEGDRLSVELTPDEAFGERDPSLVDKAPRANFPGIDHIVAGMQFQTEMDDGSPMLVTVIEVDEKWVTVDGNHELAGRHLRFELEVIEVRKATADEIAHGHAHVDGQCGHS